MATPGQISANRRNAQRSTGPSPASRERTRLNALKHGLRAELPEAEAELSPEFQERRRMLAAEHRPVGDAANWALDQAAASSLRIDRCGRAFEEAVAATQARAEVAWEQDRALEAAKVASRLPRDPAVAARQLRTTYDGVILLIEGWFALDSALEAGDWDEAQRSRALDLLGVDPANRVGRSMVDPLDGSDPIEHRKNLVAEEVGRLEQLRDEAMAPLDELERERVVSGSGAMLCKEARLILRYEKDAWRRHRESLKALKAPNEANPGPNPLPKPIAIPAPRPVPKSPPPPRPGRTFEEERQSVLAEASPYVELAKQFRELGLIPTAPSADDEDGWLDALEARIDAMPGRPSDYPAISAGLQAG
jgi:hypothetical protein